MKRWISLFLALLMISAALPTLAEETFPPDTPPQALTTDGERFYLAWGDTVYACEKDGAPQPFITHFPYNVTLAYDRAEYLNGMFVDGGTLYGVNTQSGDLYGYALTKGDARVISHIRIDLSPVTIEQDEGSYTSVRLLTAAYGKLWGWHDNWLTGQSCLVSFDLATGASQTHSAAHLSFFTPYRDGAFLAFRYDQDTAYNPDTGEFALADLGVFDPADDSFTVLRAYPMAYSDLQAAAYDAAADTLYLCTGNRIYQMAAMGEPELCAYSPYSWLTDMALAGNVAGLMDSTGFVTRTLDPATLPTEQLVIANNMAMPAHARAVAALDDVPVLDSQQDLYGDALTLALITGELDADVLCLSTTGYDVQAIMRKGYCLPLTDSQVVADYVARLYPFLQDAVTENGVIYGIPITVNTYGGAEEARDGFAATGLPKPASLDGLLDLLQRWADEGLDDVYPDYQVMEYISKFSLVNLALELWGDYLAGQNREWTLDDPVLRGILEKIDALDDSLWANPDSEDSMSRSSLMMPDLAYEPEGIAAYGILPLSLTDDLPRYTHGDVYLLAVNARTPHKEAALRYIETYIQSLTPVEAAALQADWSEPIPDPYFDTYVASAEARVTAAQTALEHAAQADIPLLQEQLEAAQADLAAVKARPYSVSPDDLAVWHDLMTHGVVSRPSIFYTDLDPNHTLRTLLRQYTDGLTSLDQFLSDAQRTLTLILRENQ